MSALLIAMFAGLLAPTLFFLGLRGGLQGRELIGPPLVVTLVGATVAVMFAIAEDLS